jgi:hypothetical protein
MTMPSKSKKRKSPPKRSRVTRRPRVMQQPNAIAFTIAGYQSVGGCGRTKVYEMAKQGLLKLFKAPDGRTLIDGDSGRALLGVKEEEAVA